MTSPQPTPTVPLQVPDPFEIDLTPLEYIFRIALDASDAISAFTQQQNYGPAIQRLIIDLHNFHVFHNCEAERDAFDLVTVSSTIQDLSDRINKYIYTHADIHHDILFLWRENVCDEDRLVFYRKRFDWDKNFNSQTEEQ